MATTPQATEPRPRESAADEAWTLLRNAVRRPAAALLTAASELELHPAQAGALLHMTPDAPRPMHELAAMLACDNSNVTGIIDRLEARGLVARQRTNRTAGSSTSY